MQIGGVVLTGAQDSMIMKLLRATISVMLGEGGVAGEEEWMVGEEEW